MFIGMDFLSGGELFLRLGRELQEGILVFRESTASFYVYVAEIILALDHLSLFALPRNPPPGFEAREHIAAQRRTRLRTCLRTRLRYRLWPGQGSDRRRRG